MSTVNIYYLYNSGFCVESEFSIFIFDYFYDKPESGNRSLSGGVISDELLKSKKDIYVFVSHNHSDHFNPVIFDWIKINPNIKYILSSDVKVKSNFKKYTTLSCGESIEYDDLYIKAYGSTDEGISFFIKQNDITMFHAGDLNWWHWKEDSKEDNLNAEKWFKREIDRLKSEKIDIAFFPVDPRQEEYYYLGGEYFINNVKPKFFIPMHFGNNPEIIHEFSTHIQNYNTKIIEIDKRGFNVKIEL